MNKEYYFEALGYLFDKANSCTNCDKVNIKCESCEKDNRMECDIAHFRLSELISEHFDNTYDFKHFKLHSKSYLKTFKKDELIDYIYMVYQNWQGTDSACNHGMKYAEKLQKINDELQRVVDELNSKETRNNPPLNFEELEVGMWVWDRELSAYIQIYAIYDTVKGIRVSSFGTFEFEENRFYRWEVKE